MKVVDIRTPQNVVISFEAASVFDRYLATFLDLIFQSLLAVILGLVYSLIANLLPNESAEYLGVFLVLVPITFYHLISELIFQGQSLGKKIIGLKVINIYGQNPEPMDYIIRWVFRGVEVMSSFGALAAVFINSSPKGQRIGDFVAKTTVIKLKPKTSVSLKDVLQISNAASYEVVYPEVKELKEVDLIHIKTLLQRHSKYPNATHQQLLKDTVQHVCNALQIENQSKNEVQFLKTLIKDYIVLTR